MTTATYYELMNRATGKVARMGLALMGMALATLVLTTATVASSGRVVFIAGGLAIVTTTVRAAAHPTPRRLAWLVAGLLTVPAAWMII